MILDTHAEIQVKYSDGHVEAYTSARVERHVTEAKQQPEGSVKYLSITVPLKEME